MEAKKALQGANYDAPAVAYLSLIYKALFIRPYKFEGV